MNWFWREWSQLVETRIQTDFTLVWFFFANATNKFTKHLPVIALHSCDSKFSRLSQKLWQKLQRYTLAGGAAIFRVVSIKDVPNREDWAWEWVGMVQWNGHFSIRPVRPGKEDHLKRWTSFFETFPVGPNRSIEFWTEISGNFGWMDRALIVPAASACTRWGFP